MNNNYFSQQHDLCFLLAIVMQPTRIPFVRLFLKFFSTSACFIEKPCWQSWHVLTEIWTEFLSMEFEVLTLDVTNSSVFLEIMRFSPFGIKGRFGETVASIF
jgi:hypothetical protein